MHNKLYAQKLNLKSLLKILYIVYLGMDKWSPRITRQHLDLLDLPVLMLHASLGVLPFVSTGD
jgi:hypothetical protein